jgi:hypothetical protein
MLKKVMENRLSGSKKHVRGVLVDRTQLQHESRLVENSSRNFTATHCLLYADLLGLATSHYSEVCLKQRVPDKHGNRKGGKCDRKMTK